jgi:hypothetical protein
MSRSTYGAGYSENVCHNSNNVGVFAEHDTAHPYIRMRQLFLP